MKRINGRIIRAVGGFYDVETAEGVFVSKARGIFRDKGISPCCGDYVEIIVEENAEPVIDKVSERINSIIRPPLANLDAALLVVSSCQPAPNAYVIDKLTAIFERLNIGTALIFTKKDLADCSELIKVYEQAGYRCFPLDNISGEGADAVRDFAFGRTTALIGNSGVGKSSLMNRIFPELNKETNEISKKLGRGRHTTREVNMYPLGGGYIADTPGFSTVDLERYVRIPKEELRYCFKEFSELGKGCRFNNCMHLKEDGCAVTAAVSRGETARSRYESYARMFAELAEAEKRF